MRQLMNTYFHKVGLGGGGGLYSNHALTSLTAIRLDLFIIEFGDCTDKYIPWIYVYVIPC